MGLCHLVASICLEEGEKDVAKKQLNPSPFVFKNKLATQSQRPQAFVEAEAVRIAQATDYSRDVSSGDVSGNEKSASPEESALEV
ncbi:hypothetical protein SLS53_001743 [Cytospora paraplurivora]|uniref:Uncharacterized protein n=1 Tax=Cytospora paraplurivora TaxID=2898453 RepID=A0AAN9URL4_9PEZI